jgi:hypothetical protein
MGNAIVDELLQPAPAYESHSIGPNGQSFFSEGFRKWSCYCLSVFIGVCDENIAVTIPWVLRLLCYFSHPFTLAKVDAA